MARGSVTNNIIQYRSDLGPLTASHPQLGREVRELVERLDKTFSDSIPSASHGITLEEAMQNVVQLARRDRDAQRLHELLKEIRNLNGFENFMSTDYEGKQFAMNAAKDGSIIIVSACEKGHAIIVTSNDVEFIWLEGLSEPEAKTKMAALKSTTSADVITAHKSTRELLEWLWRTVTEPVLLHLGLPVREPIRSPRKRPSRQSTGIEAVSKLPRVWWIGVGCIAQAPFHAAGIYPRNNRAAARYTAKYCVSSYTPTIRALAYAQQHINLEPDAQLHQNRALVVTMPRTPSDHAEAASDSHHKLDDTPSYRTHGIMFAELDVATEADNITQSFKTAEVPCTLLDSPEPAMVLCSLAYHNIVHLACHGLVDSENPSKSCLVLQRPTDIEEKTFIRDELTLADIMKVRVAHNTTGSSLGRLAYLSACSSASNRCDGLDDESLHIAGVFQAAGFNNVVGTLWNSQDGVCIKVAISFYKYLFEIDKMNEKGKGTGRKLGCADALHLAVEDVRNQNEYWQAPYYWAPFVHWGA
ncbi:CHAT domain-containing protein [Kalaharituber pfeilii]|nr:CHAT domain-containing protein [Kalaharituber pfeilii]